MILHQRHHLALLDTQLPCVARIEVRQNHMSACEGEGEGEGEGAGA